MKLSHKTMIFLSGLVWVAIGVFLLSLGIRFVLETIRHPVLTQMPGCFSISTFFGRFVSDGTQVTVLTITLSLLLGYFKGKKVLAKSAVRQIKRIESLPNPASIKYLYSKGYYFLIALMILLGVSMRFLPITLDTRGAIDITIGSALINGAMLYFRKLSQQNYLLKRKT